MRVIRSFSTYALMPQRGLAWQLGSQTVRTVRVSDTVREFSRSKTIRQAPWDVNQRAVTYGKNQFR
jgi:hypothetical protein